MFGSSMFCIHSCMKYDLLDGYCMSPPLKVCIYMHWWKLHFIRVQCSNIPSFLGICCKECPTEAYKSYSRSSWYGKNCYFSSDCVSHGQTRPGTGELLKCLPFFPAFHCVLSDVIVTSILCFRFWFVLLVMSQWTN